MFRGLVDTIIGNLQLSIGNVHVRYEVRPHTSYMEWGNPCICFRLAPSTGLHIAESGPEESLPPDFANVCSVLQDSTSNPGTVFAVGLTLESLSTHTVNESGQRAFVTQNPLKLLRKVLPASSSCFGNTGLSDGKTVGPALGMPLADHEEEQGVRI